MARRRKKIGASGQIFIIVMLLVAGAFLSTTVILLVGMIPTMVAMIADKTKGRTLWLTVGAMNLAGCTPFMFELWKNNLGIEQSVEILSNPLTIVVMYAAAGLGYIVDWAVTGIVASLMIEKGKARLNDIENRQMELVRKWGKEVTGNVKLDHEGQPIK